VLSFADIIKMAQEYGLETMVGILLMGVIYLFAKGHVDVWAFKKKHQIESSKAFPEEDFDSMIDDILKSEFFRNIKFKITVDIPAEHFSEDATLDMLYKDLLICLYTSYQNVLYEKVSKMKKSDTAGMWVNSFLEIIYYTMDEFDKSTERMNIHPEIVAEFTSWFSPFLHQIYNYVTIIDLSEPGCVVRKTKLFLLTLELILVNATAQAQKFQVFEGKFNGKEYKGNTIGNKIVDS